MPNLPLPYKGYSVGKTPETEDPLTTPVIHNVRPRDTLEGRIRLGQRPGFVRVFTGSIAAAGQYPRAMTFVCVDRIEAEESGE